MDFFIPLFVISLSPVLCQDLFFVDENLYMGSSCVTAGDELGQCGLKGQCEGFPGRSLADRACGFQGKHPLVCCPLGLLLGSRAGNLPGHLTPEAKTPSTESTRAGSDVLKPPVITNILLGEKPPTGAPLPIHPDIISILLGQAPKGAFPFGQDPGPSTNIIEAMRGCGSNSVTRLLVRNIFQNIGVTSGLSQEMLLQNVQEKIRLLTSSLDSDVSLKIANRFNYMIKNLNLNIPVIKLPTTETGMTTEDLERDLKERFIPDVNPSMLLGGVLSFVGEWPWMVQIGVGTPSSKPGEGSFNPGSFSCDGVLIDPVHVLTAAHCIHRDMNVVRIGEYDTGASDEFEKLLGTPSSKYPQDIGIEQVFIHPDYKESQWYNNIAILKLSETVFLQTHNDLYPAAICLPGQHSSFRGHANVTLSGWGAYKRNGSRSDVLRTLIDMPLVPNIICEFSYRRSDICPSCKLPTGIPDTMICIGDAIRGQGDSCQGKSGGPAVVMNQDTGRWTLIGIIAGGKECGDGGVPGLLTDVESFMPWIKTVTGNLNIDLQ